MPVPDTTYFGERPEGGGINYGDVRSIKDEEYKLVILKTRLDTLLINQIDVLVKKDANGSMTNWSPFPLMVMTFISIETLGRCVLNIDKIKIEFPKEASKGISTKIYQLIDTKLINKPTKKFYTSFCRLHNNETKTTIDRYSDVLHTYQRNTFTHGYQARGVYLSHGLEVPWAIEEADGYLIVNPYLFWELFKHTYGIVWEEISLNKNSEWRKNAIKYLCFLLS